MSKYLRAVNFTEEKNAVDLLAEDGLIDIFNHLLENNFLDHRDGKIRLTSKGKEAKEKVCRPVTVEQETKKALAEFSDDKRRLGLTFFLLSICLFLLSVLFFFLIHWGGQVFLDKIIWIL